MIDEEQIAALKKKAIWKYETTMCGGAGCCGDIEGALDLFAETLQEMLSIYNRD